MGKYIVDRVVGILPKEVIDVMANKMTIDEAIDKGLLEEEDNNEFAELRRDLIFEAVGITDKNYEKMKKRQKRLLDEGDGIKHNDIDEVLRAMDVAEVQDKSNKKSLRSAFGNLLSGLSNCLISFSANLAGLVSLLMGLPVIPYLATGFGAVASSMGMYKTLKANKGNTADFQEKQMNADEKVMEFLEKFQKLEDILDSDRAMLLIKKKELTKSEFKEFVTVYMKLQLEKLNIASNLTRLDIFEENEKAGMSRSKKSKLAEQGMC